jgi:HK97 family phage major capsid protein
MTNRITIAAAALACVSARGLFAQAALGGPLMLRGPSVPFAPDDDRSAAELAADIKKDFEKKFDDVKEKAEKAVAEAQKGIDQTKAQKEIIDGALISMNEAKGRLDEIEQKLARQGPTDEPEERKSIGERFVESDSMKEFKEGGFASGQRASHSMKATLTSATTDAAGSVGAGVSPTRLQGIVALPQRKLTVRDLISPGRMDGSSIEYVKETGFVNNAAPVGEGNAKPSSDLKMTLVTTSAKVIAHWMKASRQILDDFSQLRSVIDERLLYGLKFVEDQQILLGDGTGQNLNGIVPQASAYAAPIAIPGATSIDMMRLAMLQAALALYPATGHVMNPIDWAWIEMQKDGEGRYIIGNPQGSITPTLWGLPVVETMAMAQDKFLTGAFKAAAQLFDRWEARVEAGYVNDDFIKNLVTLLGEERLALAVYRPEAFIYGDFGRVA